MALTPKQVEIRDMAETDLKVFARLLNPQRLYGQIHDDVMDWLMLDEPNQLLLLPRAHQKSHLMALWTTWWITKHPEVAVIYISATSTLAEAQLYAIKAMLDSPIYKRFWPDMTNPDEGRRERWNVSEIMVDHPKRKAEGIRDATIKTVGLTATSTGLHADVIVYDDVVVPENAYTEENRRKVAGVLSQFASIRNAGGITKAAGTRYHPKDQYSTFKKQEVTLYDDKGNPVGRKPRWSIYEKTVETEGEFLWPRQYRSDGKWFGFNDSTLSEIKSEYEDKTQFYAQYYNSPEDPEGAKLKQNDIQYYNKSQLVYQEDGWFYGEDKLSVFAAIDFAWSLNQKADYTTIAVVGVNYDNKVFILDIIRFKTDNMVVYFDNIVAAHNKWGFNKLRAEVVVAQEAIVKELKRSYIDKYGLRIVIDEYRPSRREGTKEERIDSILLPKYAAKSIFHYRGGNNQVLEEELLMTHPPHDDCKDALAAAIDVAVPPYRSRTKHFDKKKANIITTRYGGYYT